MNLGDFKYKEYEFFIIKDFTGTYIKIKKINGKFYQNKKFIYRTILNKNNQFFIPWKDYNQSYNPFDKEIINYINKMICKFFKLQVLL